MVFVQRFIIIIFLFVGFALKAEVARDSLKIQAKVIRILDGDTMEVLYHKLPVKIRLAHIDCPEKKGSQPFGNVAKKTLSDLVFGKNVIVNSALKYDGSGRLIAEILTIDGVNVNMQMVRKGMAWHYKKYSKNNVYGQLEIVARQQKIGLWQDPYAIAPWVWRKRKKNINF